MSECKINIHAAVISVGVIVVVGADYDRTERLPKGIDNTQGWHNVAQDRKNYLSRYGFASYSSVPETYFDYGIFPYGVNVPPRAYLPPLPYPDYSGAYPPASRPPPAASPAPAHPPAYLPPHTRPTSTTTEFTLPEVVDARDSPHTPNDTNSATEPKQSADKANRNRWGDINTYQNGYPSEPVKIIEMKCDNGIEGRFRAVLQLAGGRFGLPVFEDSQGGRTDGECVASAVRGEGDGDGSRLLVDLTSSSFPACGVTDCSANEQASYLCTRLRFPTVEGLRLADDTVLTLRCRIQEPLAIHTKHFQLPVSAVAERSAGGVGAVVTGGASSAVRCSLDVLRRGASGGGGGSEATSGFTRRLTAGARVQLGEELLVRLSVADGDGWQFSRLGETVLSAGGGGGEAAGAAGAAGASRRLTLLTAEGCVAPGTEPICSRPPRAHTPLTHTLLIRAPIFEGSAGDASVQLSVSVLACRRAHSCVARCGRVRRSLSPSRHRRRGGRSGDGGGHHARREPIEATRGSSQRRSRVNPDESNSTGRRHERSHQTGIYNEERNRTKHIMTDLDVTVKNNTSNVNYDVEDYDFNVFVSIEKSNPAGTGFGDSLLGKKYSGASFEHGSNLERNRPQDGRKVRAERDVEGSSKVTAASVTSVNFTVVRPAAAGAAGTSGSAEAEGAAGAAGSAPARPTHSHVKSKGVNDKPVAMIIALGGLVSGLMLAVIGFLCNYRNREQKFS